MLPRHIVPAAFLAASLFAVPSVVSAQASATKPAPSTTTPATGQNAATPKVAAPAVKAKEAPAEHPKIHMTRGAEAIAVPVTGLSKETSAPVMTALTGLSEGFYECPGCKHEQADAGHCTTCDKDLVAQHALLLRDVSVDATKGSVSFQVAPHRSLHLHALTQSLSTAGVTLTRDKLTTSEAGSLVVTGVTADTAAKLVTALRDTRLFETVSGHFDTASRELVLTILNGPVSPALARVDEALAKADPAARLTDLVWSGPTVVG